MRSAVSIGCEMPTTCDAPATSTVRLARRALGHDLVRPGRDVVVELTEDEPARHRPPQRAVAARLEQRRLGDGSLGDRHAARLSRGQIGGELVVVPVLRRCRCRCRRRASGTRSSVSPSVDPGASADASPALSPGSQGEPGDVDERRRCRRRPGSTSVMHRAAVGVADQHDRAVDAPDEVAQRGGIGRDAAQRVGARDDAVPVGGQRLDHAVPARRVGERAVDEDDRGA